MCFKNLSLEKTPNGPGSKGTQNSHFDRHFQSGLPNTRYDQPVKYFASLTTETQKVFYSHSLLMRFSIFAHFIGNICFLSLDPPDNSCARFSIRFSVSHARSHPYLCSHPYAHPHSHTCTRPHTLTHTLGIPGLVSRGAAWGLLKFRAFILNA